MTTGSCRQHTAPTDPLNLLLRQTGEKFRLDDDGLLGQQGLAQHLVVAGLDDVDDWGILLVLGEVFAGVLRCQRPYLVQIGGQPSPAVLVEVEIAHTDFSGKKWDGTCQS